MIEVKFGNTAPVDPVLVEAADRSEAHRIEAGPDGSERYMKLDRRPLQYDNGREDNNAVTVFRVPDGTRLTEAVMTVTRAYEGYHSDNPPEWVEVDGSDILAQALVEHYTTDEHKCRIGRPRGWKGQEEESSDAPPARGGGGDDASGDKEQGEEYAPYFPLDAAELRTFNLRTNAGADWQSRVMGDTASNGTGNYASATYLALSEDATAVAVTDTTLTGELTTGGLGRSQATYAHTASATNYTLTKTWTSSDGSSRTIRKVGTFNASSSGSMPFVSAVGSPPTIISGDSLTITETVNLV